MSQNGRRYIKVRSNGKGVIGKVYETDKDTENPVSSFKGSTRTHMLRKFRSKYNPNNNIVINRRGRTDF